MARKVRGVLTDQGWVEKEGRAKLGEGWGTLRWAKLTALQTGHLQSLLPHLKRCKTIVKRAPPRSRPSNGLQSKSQGSKGSNVHDLFRALSPPPRSAIGSRCCALKRRLHQAQNKQTTRRKQQLVSSIKQRERNASATARTQSNNKWRGICEKRQRPHLISHISQDNHDPLCSYYNY